MARLAAFTIIVLIWGFYYLVVDISLTSGWSPYFLNAARFLLAAPLFLPLLALKQETSQLISLQKEMPLRILAISFVGVVLGVGLLTLGQESVSSGISGVIGSTTSLWTALLGLTIFFNTERLRPLAWLGLALGIAGVVLLFAPWSEASLSPKGFFLLLFGAVFIALEAQLLLKWFSGRPLLPVAALTVFWSGIIFLVITALAGTWDTGNLWSLLFLTVASNAVAWSLYIWLVQKSGPTFANTYAFLIPIIALAAGWAFNEEEITQLILFGSALCLLAAALVARGSSLKEASQKSVSDT